MATKLQLRRGLKIGIPTLSVGEPGWVTDESKLYVGTGTANVCINPNELTVGITAGLPLLTGSGGKVEAAQFGSAAATFCQGDDSRLSNARTPESHTHGALTNDGKIVTDATIASGDKLLVRDVSASDVVRSSSITFGTSDTTFLRNDGQWQAPPAGQSGSITKTTFGSRSTTGTFSLSGITLSEYDEIELEIHVAHGDSPEYNLVLSSKISRSYYLTIDSPQVFGGGQAVYVTSSTTNFGAVRVYPGQAAATSMFVDFLSGSPAASVTVRGIKYNA